MGRVERKYYPNGTLQEEVHFSGKKEHGPWRRWHPNGVLAEEYWFEDGEYVTCTTRTWHSNGQLESEVTFVDRKQIGWVFVFSDDGSPITRTFLLEHGEVSKDEYDAACKTRPELPRYAGATGENG